MIKSYICFSVAFFGILIVVNVLFQLRANYLKTVPNSTQILTKTQNSTIKKSDGCPNGTILYIHDGGGTGNKIWAYLSVLAVYKVYPEKRFFPYIPDSIINRLEETFEPLPAMSKLPEKCRNFKGLESIYQNKNDIKNVPNNTKVVQLAQFSRRYEDIILYGFDKVREELRYKPNHTQVVMDTLNELKKNFSMPSKVNPIYVGVHFRGTDYTPLIKSRLKDKFKEPTHEFYSKAMSYFTDIYKNVIFILVSVDYKWIEANSKHLKGNLVVNPYKDNKILDMTLLSHCNHSIINYGTFGATVAMLAGGTTIVYDLKVPVGHGEDSMLAMAISTKLKNWLIMS